VLVLFGCGDVKDNTPDASSDAPPIDARPIDAPDLSPHLVFVTSTHHSGSLGGLAGADMICQQRAQAAGLPGTYQAWLADANSAPATRMTRHLGPYRLVTGAVIAQGWADLTDSMLATRIDRTEGGVQRGGVGCDFMQPTCSFICAGGEVWSNVSGDGTRRATGDCTSWTGTGSGTAGNVSRLDAEWTAGSCSAIGCVSTLPLFCVQQ